MKVGSLVIRDKDHESLINLLKLGNQIPDKESIYTVRDIIATAHGVLIRLEEIHNPVMKYSGGMAECAFNMDLFREVQSPDELNISELLEDTILIPFFVGNGY